eukprot:4201-Eustigmatos_ZCMA.PRE.1
MQDIVYAVEIVRKYSAELSSNGKETTAVTAPYQDALEAMFQVDDYQVIRGLYVAIVISQPDKWGFNAEFAKHCPG